MPQINLSKWAQKHRAALLTSGILIVSATLIAIVLLLFSGLIAGVLIGTFGVSGLAASLLMAYLTRPGIVQKRLAYIYKFISKIYTKADKSFVAADIEGVINTYTEDEIGFDSSYGVSVNWADNTDKSTILENGDVIICLDKGEHQSENLARASVEYAKKGVVPESRHYLDEPVNKGINYCVSHNILDRTGEEDALRILWNDIILPELENSKGEIDEEKELTENYYKVDDTRRGGIFGPVLLSEYEKLSSYGRPDDQIRRDTEQFLNFLHEIATKNRGEDVPLRYEGDTIDVHIVLAAKTYIDDADPYIDSCKKGLAKANTTYLLSVGRNIPLAEETVATIKELPGVDEFEETYHLLDDDSYFGGEKEAYCARFESVKQNW